jgi:hypothetical protein
MRTDPEPNAARQLLYQLLPLDTPALALSELRAAHGDDVLHWVLRCIPCFATMLLWALPTAGQFVPGEADG